MIKHLFKHDTRSLDELLPVRQWVGLLSPLKAVGGLVCPGGAGGNQALLAAQVLRTLPGPTRQYWETQVTVPLPRKEENQDSKWVKGLPQVPQLLCRRTGI